MDGNSMRSFMHDIKSSLGVVANCLDPLLEATKVPAFRDMARRNVVKALSLVAQLDEKLLTTDYKFIVSSPVSALEIHTTLEEFIPIS